MSFEEFQDGRRSGPLEYRIRTSLAILNLYVTSMPPINFLLNMTYDLGPSWISERNDFNNSEALCHSDASHRVLAQFNLRFRRRCRLKNFKMAAVNGTILAILNLYVATMPPTKFQLNPTYESGGRTTKQSPR